MLTTIWQALLRLCGRERVFVVTGVVIDEAGKVCPGLFVEAHLHAEALADRPVGQPAISDTAGRYRIVLHSDRVFARGSHRRGAAVRIVVTDFGKVLAASDAVPIKGEVATIDIRLRARADGPETIASPADGFYRVYGTIRDQYGVLVNGVTVQAYDRDLRSEEFLASTPVNDGVYEIDYTQTQFAKSEKNSADLVLKVIDPSTGALVYQTPVQFNAPADFRFDFGYGGTAYNGPSEWEVVDGTIMPLLDGVAPSDLREDDTNRDITFLSGETSYERLAIVRWVACYRLARRAGDEQLVLSPTALYAFVRQGQPSIFYDTLEDDMQHDDRAALFEEKVLRELSELDPNLQRTLLEKAISANLVPASLISQIGVILAALQRTKMSYAGSSTFGAGKGTIGDLLKLAVGTPDGQNKFLTVFTAHTGPLKDFWTSLKTGKVFDPPTVDKLQLIFEVGALTKNHVPLVAELTRRIQAGAIPSKRALSALTSDDWVALFLEPGPDGKPIGVPSNIDGATDEEKRRQFAAILGLQLERVYPTAAFAAKLDRAAAAGTAHARREETKAAGAPSDMVIFLQKNQQFMLDRHRIDHFIAENPGSLESISDKTKLVADLKTTQRMFRLQPTYEGTTALLSRGIDSAQQIYFMGRGQFVAGLAQSGINALDAKKIYAKAAGTYASALNLFGTYNIALNLPMPFGVPNNNPKPPDQQKLRAIPNLAALFGSLDYCECIYCRSVYSPAAYFVDVMRYLGDRSTQGTGPNAGRKVLDVLLDRRPDLGEIELSCDNTNTPLPYVDLALEILEDAVSPPAPVNVSGAIEGDLIEGTIKSSVLTELTSNGIAIGALAYVYPPDSRGQWAVRDDAHAYRIFKTGTQLQVLPTKQTFLSAAELRAYPQYTNDSAYNVLKAAVFPLDLPFDLWDLQACAYLDHLGLPRPMLLTLFQQLGLDDATLAPSDLQIDCAWLAITESERQVLDGTFVGNSWDFWGLRQTGNDLPNPAMPSDPTTNVQGTWLQVLANVEVMLNRSGLSYVELLQVLDMTAVDPDGKVAIFDTADPNAASCDTSKFVLQNLTQDVLDRLHRFIRLWRKLGCTMWELDILLPDADPDPAVIDKKITGAVLQDISRMNRVRKRGGLDWRIVNALYHGIDNAAYVDRANDGAAIQTLYQRLFRNKLVDSVSSFPADPASVSGAVADSVPGILAAFQVKEADFDLILTALSLATSDPLTMDVLNRIHGLVVLAHGAGLSIDDCLRLRSLWGQDPLANPGATLDFLKLADKVQVSRFAIVELDYLLAHRIEPGSGVAIQDADIVALMRALRDGLQKVSDGLELGGGQTNEAYVKDKLGQLPTLAADADQVTALSLINGTWTGTAADRLALLATLFTGVLDPAVAAVQLAAIPAGLSPADYQAQVDARFAYAQPALQAYLIGVQSTALIQDKTASALSLDTPSTAALLAALHLKGSTTTLLRALDDPNLIAQNADGTYGYALDEASFPYVFEALRLLHKSAMMIRKLKLKAVEVQWWLAGGNAAGMGWVGANDFPVDTTAPLAIASWLSMQQFFQWKTGVTETQITAIQFATNLLDNTVTSATSSDDLVKLTAWDSADLATLATAFHWLATAPAFDVVKQNLRDSKNLVRLADCMKALKRLGVNAARAVGWTQADADAVIADSIKQAVKAKYDLAQWQQVVQPFQDGFREKKRVSLVSWLLAHPDQAKGQNWVKPDDLYGYFLIDVQMCSCMLTSRLKQAAASAQLFVQRCLLNLEVDILANTVIDRKWKQWEWMKRFRVWEANRKVFLYPENWIEPELRKEKSPFFEELEATLKQNEVTVDNVEDAYLAYLEKLELVANLEIRAMYDQVIDSDQSVLHVFGRSRSSQSPSYYYRQRIDGARWTAWTDVGLDIGADHLMTGMANRRLYLLWPQFIAKALAPTSISTPDANSTATIAAPTRYWEVRLTWSELKNDKWTQKSTSDSYITVYQSETGGDYTENIAFRVRNAPNVQVRLYDSTDPSSVAPAGAIEFDKIGRHISRLTPSAAEHIIAPPGGRYFNNLIRHDQNTQYFYYSVKPDSVSKPHQLSAQDSALSLPVLTAVTPSLTYSVIDSEAASFLGNGSFFNWDKQRTYFADYTWRQDYAYVSRTWYETQAATFTFRAHYHPYVDLFIKELNIWGIDGLLNRRIQVDPTSIPDTPAAFEFTAYGPTTLVTQPYPAEVVDFDYAGAYAPYNWELFFHVPMYIANRLSDNQQFEDALAWYNYIFDPTSTDTSTPSPDTPQQKFWITKPFYELTKSDYYAQKIENIMLAIAEGDAALRAQVEEWRQNPSDPHLIARMRIVAYQKNVLIKYIETLIAWGDQLFRQNTIETINEASQLYVLAASVLGPRPKSIPRNEPNPVQTFYQLRKEGIDDFGNALKEIENLVPPFESGSGPDSGDQPDLPRLDVLYFCIPNNDKLLTLWDTVEDRLFKIRHCMNIEGMVQQLPLFDPPIDPGMLVKAAAAGLDIGAVLSDANAPLPLYRFTTTIQRALEVCQEVKALGAAMLSALEKRDAEALALLRSSHEITMLDLVRIVKSAQVDETETSKEALDAAFALCDARRLHYQGLIDTGWNDFEKAWLGLTIGAIVAETAGTIVNATAAATSFIPEFDLGVAGFGASPTVKVKFGGQNISNGAAKAADILKGVAQILQMGASMTSTIGTYFRRAEDWDLQKTLAEKELAQITKQIVAAEIRHDIATQELTNQDKQIDNAQAENDFLTSKFTNQDLYDWMKGEISTVYFQSYQLAYDLAKRAERCLRYELGLSDSNYIQFGYWDSLKKGLLAGEKLFYDLRRLEAAYFEQNRREYELTKKVSLAQLDPVALLKLKENGECFVDIPELAFDTDYPGHYFRRLKTVALSIPCTTGPYTTISCTLTLIGNRLRIDATLLAGKYPRDTAADDPRFRDEIAAIQSVATSHAQSDRGLFELNYRDERYLPFEGAGAISSWHIKLNKDFAQFDFATISDVIMELGYTAREGGEVLRAACVDDFSTTLSAIALAESRKGLFRVFDLKREYSADWHRFLHPANPADDQQFVLGDLADRLPYFTRGFANKMVTKVEIVALAGDGGAYDAMLSPLGTAPADYLPMTVDSVYGGLHRGVRDLGGSPVPLNALTLKLKRNAAGDFKSLADDDLTELFLIVNYTVA